MTDRTALAQLTDEIVACRACPRLVEWRERVARDKVARFRDEPYWGRPLPGFGDPDGRILIIGLAPGRPRRQPDGTRLHGRQVGRLPVVGAPRRGAGGPAVVAPSRRRPDPDRRLHRRRRPVRAAAQQADERRARHLRAVPGPRDRAADGAAGHPGARASSAGTRHCGRSRRSAIRRSRSRASGTTSRTRSARIGSSGRTTRASRTRSRGD